MRTPIKDVKIYAQYILHFTAKRRTCPHGCWIASGRQTRSKKCRLLEDPEFHTSGELAAFPTRYPKTNQ